jgi:hypothetical protein
VNLEKIPEARCHRLSIHADTAKRHSDEQPSSGLKAPRVIARGGAPAEPQVSAKNASKPSKPL